MPAAEERDQQAFWSIAIGVPIILSVLRLWVEAGGELQTTLLLVEHIDPINLVAALVATGSWLISALFVAALAVGGVLNASGPSGQDTRLGRLVASAPAWIRLGSFALAAVTWQIIYLPLLLLAACAAFQLSPWTGRFLRGLLISLTALVAYFVVVGQTLADASRLGSGREIAMLLLAGPPVLALFVAGPLRPWLVRPWAVLMQAVAAVLFVWVAVPMVTTPVLPLTVTVVRGEDTGEAPAYVRGHVITTDDVHTVILGEDGEVRHIRNERVEGQHLCPTEEEIPRYRLKVDLPEVEPVYVEQSLLRALGQAHRGSAAVNPACRIPTD